MTLKRKPPNSEATSTGAAQPADSPPVEVELKLATDLAGLKALASDSELAGLARNQGTVRRLETVYFDTPDHRLSRRGAALRVRKVGRKYIQTLKTEGAQNLAGLTERDEWEWPVSGLAPDLSVIDEAAARRVLGVMDAADLEPLFATKFRRQARMIDHAGATIELAIDDGTIEAGDQAVPLREVELELKSGPAEAAYTLALTLARIAPLGLEPRSKAARGYALATGAIAAPVKRSVAVPPSGATVDDALAVYLADCLSHFTQNVPAVVDGRDPEGVHQARVGLRRLRSCLNLFKVPLPDGQGAAFNDQARRLANRLGHARDLDVFLGEVLPPIAEALGTGTLDPLRAAAEAERAQAYETARAVVTGPEASRFALEFGHWIATRGWRQQPYSREAALLDDPLLAVADHLLARRHAKLLKRGRHFARLSLDERHEVRKTAKKLRYAVEFFAPLHKAKQVKPFEKALKGLQERLGALQDQVAANVLVDQLVTDQALARAGGVVEGWLAREIAGAEKKLIQAWRGFAEAKPFWQAKA
jgi:inorganic triphosphatase YgiF